MVVASPETEMPEVSYEFTAAVMRTRFFRAGSEKPVWSLMTVTKYQESPFKQIDPFAAVIVRRLAADKMIK